VTATLRDRALAVAAPAILALAVLLSGCGEPLRPTLTSEPFVEGAPTADGTAADGATAVPQATSSTGGASPTAEADAGPATVPTGVEQLVVQVLETLPHDPAAFTQGLELHDGDFIESTGLYGQSDLRVVDPATGAVERRVTIPPEFFAEGVTRVGDQLVQLTWQENTAFYWDLATFEQRQTVSYTGEGWGICYDSGFQETGRLVMTNGTPDMVFRDPATFDEIGRVSVTLEGQPVFNLNEVECVGGAVWANIWQTDTIVRIDPATGVVTGVVDAASLDGPDETSGAVLNGIAWDESTRSFYVTGKLWPTMYRVNFVPAPGG